MNKLFVYISLLFYNFGIALYILAIKLLAIKNKKAYQWVKGRKNILNNIVAELKPGEKRVWFHCASLGEFEQGRTLIELLKEKEPEIKIVLTFFSPSGYEVRKNYKFADYIFYLPADTHQNAKKFIQLIDPAFAVFIKYEFWYHYFRRLEKEHITLIVVSAAFRKNQIFFKWYGSLFRKLLYSVSHFFVQDEKSEYFLRKIGFGNITIIQDTRIDRVAQIPQIAKRIPEIKLFLADKKAVVGGSIYLAEAKILKQAKQDGILPEKLILVPHNVSEENIKNIQSLWGIQAVLFSEVGDPNIDLKNADVLIVNTIGLLSSIYQYGKYAIIGGGFGHSIHNILEPAAFGLPIIFGPHYYKFKEAHELLASAGAFSFKTYNEFRILIEKLNNPAQLSEAGQVASAYINQRTGSTEKIYSWLLEKGLLDS